MEDLDWKNINIQTLSRHLHRLRDPNDAAKLSDGSPDSRPTLDTVLDNSSSPDLLYHGDAPWYNKLVAARWDTDTKVSVVCKVAADSRDAAQAIRQEAAFYESDAGRELQDCHYIPHYYGIFGGKWERVTVMCIVLEHCGEATPSIDALMRRGKDFW